MSAVYIVYADGACSGNPGPGGWAFEIITDSTFQDISSSIIQDLNIHDKFRTGSGMDVDTTNNRMELTAAYQALSALNRSKSEPGHITLRLDSQYVLDGLFKYLMTWKKNGWKTAAKKPIKNQEMWDNLDTIKQLLEMKGFTLAPNWVKGHDGEEGNERVDTEAQAMRDLAIQSSAPAEEMSLGDRLAAEIQDATLPDGTVGEHNQSGFDPMHPATHQDFPDLAMGAPILGDRLEEALKGATLADQVDLMRTILDLYASGDYSVKKVIEEVRKNATALGMR